MSMIGAVICAYEDSGFLLEAISRIYRDIDKILILSNTRTWRGEGDSEAREETLLSVIRYPDPDDKMTIISDYWPSEEDQRNFGNKYLYMLGYDWTFIVDDDELYNRSELQASLDIVRKNEGGHACYLMCWQTYWHDRETILDTAPFGIPMFVRTNPSETAFSVNREVTVFGGLTWDTIPISTVACHHMSYVRDTEKIRKKICNTSHADMNQVGWFENHWLKWAKGDDIFLPHEWGKGISHASADHTKYGRILEPLKY